ncbi:hypothetical protein GCM10027568_11000 [Humibacter soli]
MAAQWNDSQISAATPEQLSAAYKNGSLDAILGRTVSHAEAVQMGQNGERVAPTEAPEPVAVTEGEITRVLAYLRQQGSVLMPTATPGTDVGVPAIVED